MKAIQLRHFAPIEKKPLHLVDLPVPEPAADEIRIRIHVCGVCHTDLHTVEGELPDAKLPLVPGHQVVGTVAGRGDQALRFKEGERVGAAWLYSTDGRCGYCRSDRENLCGNARFTGYSADGGYAEYMVIPEKFAYRIPDIFPDAEAAPLLCGGIIGYRSLRLSEILPGGKLGLIGFGASAHIAIQVAVYWGCRVYVVSRSDQHRNLALDLGAAWAGTIDQVPPEKLDAVINFSPAGGTVPIGMRLLEKGGTQALAGIYMTKIPEMDYNRDLYHERTLRSVANATRRDGEDFLNIAAEIPIRTTTSVFPLEQANDVLKVLKDGMIDGAAVLEIGD